MTLPLFLVPFFFLYFSYVALVMGLSFFSLIFYFRGDKELARHLLSNFIFNPTTIIFLALLFLSGYHFLSPFFGKTLKNSFLFTSFVSASFITLLGLLPLYNCAENLKNQIIPQKFSLLSGFLGLGILLPGFFLFVHTSTLLLDPEKWLFVRSFYHTPYSWNLPVRSLLFFSYALALSSGYMLLLSKEHSSVRNFSLWLLFFSLFPMPILLLWSLFTLPEIATPVLLFVLFALISFLFLITGKLLYSMSQDTHKDLSRAIVSVLLLTLFLMVAGDGAGAYFALGTRFGFKPKPVKVVTPSRPAFDAQAVFKEKCSSCHDLQKRLVGPALNSVLPKYKGRSEELKKFLENPAKKNPEFPPMPNQDLTGQEAQELANYLLKMEEEK